MKNNFIIILFVCFIQNTQSLCNEKIIMTEQKMDISIVEKGYQLVKPDELHHQKLYNDLLLKTHSTWFVGVMTTGIACRFGCSAQIPKLQNVLFARRLYDLIGFGYIECKVCHPLTHTNADITKIKELENSTFPQKVKDYSYIALEEWMHTHHHCEFRKYSNMKRVNYMLNNKDSTKLLPGEIYYQRFWSPLGPMVACATKQGICLLEFSDRIMLEGELSKLRGHFKGMFIQKTTEILSLLFSELSEYFNGARTTFSVPLHTVGSDFDKQVWQKLIDIPYGNTTTYGALAQKLGTPNSARPVANSNGRNMLSILIPCHRVIAANGALTGYGGGLERKKSLLDLEEKSEQKSKKTIIKKRIREE